MSYSMWDTGILGCLRKDLRARRRVFCHPRPHQFGSHSETLTDSCWNLINRTRKVCDYLFHSGILYRNKCNQFISKSKSPEAKSVAINIRQILEAQKPIFEEVSMSAHYPQWQQGQAQFHWWSSRRPLHLSAVCCIQPTWVKNHKSGQTKKQLNLGPHLCSVKVLSKKNRETSPMCVENMDRICDMSGIHTSVIMISGGLCSVVLFPWMLMI